MSKFRVDLNKEACQGFGGCVELCPKFFQLSNFDGKSTIEGAIKSTQEKTIINETLELEELECVREAAENCPFNAIHIVELETGEKLI